MDTKATLTLTLQLLCGLIYLSSADGFQSYLRLVGFGCDKLNIISDDFNCPSEGNYSVAGVCDRYVRCVKEKTKNIVKDEPYMEFCDIGKNYVRGKCTQISDPYDCPQSHCKWVREDTSTSKADSTTLSPQHFPFHMIKSISVRDSGISIILFEKREVPEDSMLKNDKQ